MFGRVVSRLVEVRGRRSEVSLTRRRSQTADHRPRTGSESPLSAPCPLRPRRGISLTEVLIAMGIMTVGLLGVASLFPVGSYYMQKADIANNGSAIAQSVMSDIVTKGWLNPAAWVVTIPANVAVVGQTFPSDAQYAPVTHPITTAILNANRGKFARPFALALQDALNQPTASTDATLIAKQFGAAYVIDPLGISALSFPNGNLPTQQASHIPAGTFPASTYTSFAYYGSYPGWANTAWSPWLGTSANAPGPWAWPIRRVTFQQPSTGWQMDEPLARQYFNTNDDLTTDFPPRTDRPPSQNWDIAAIGGQRTPLARQSTGNYSWIVTVVPTTNAARDGMARDPEGFSYDVSVVVFYKRVLPRDVTALYTDVGAQLPAFSNALAENERAVRASVVSTGLNGGEMLLTDFGDDPKKSAFDSLKPSEWMLICGPHPNSSTTDPRFVFNWYQVLAIDKEGTGVSSFDPRTQRIVTLRGPQWPWQQGWSVSNNLCAGICRGAVAVHTKTMRLESPRTSATSPIVPPGVPPIPYRL